MKQEPWGLGKEWGAGGSRRKKERNGEKGRRVGVDDQLECLVSMRGDRGPGKTKKGGKQDSREKVRPRARHSNVITGISFLEFQ